MDLGSVEGLEDAYGRNSIVGVDKLSGMISSLLDKFSELTLMQNFDQDKLLFFVGSQHHTIQRVTKQYIEEQSEDLHAASRGSSSARLIDVAVRVCSAIHASTIDRV